MKIFNTLNPRPGDSNHTLIEKLIQKMGGSPKWGDNLVELLKKILKELGGTPVPGDTVNSLLAKILASYTEPVPSGGENLSGAASPLNVVTPDFVGQVFVQDDGTIWQAGSLLNSSWTAVCAPSLGDGLLWGPAPETVDSIEGSTDVFLTELTNRFPTSAYTILSFGQPTSVTNGVAFDGGTTLSTLIFRNLETVGQSLSAGACPSLTLFQADELVSIGGFFDLNSCPSLTSISAKKLATVAGDGVTGIDLQGVAATTVVFESLSSCQPRINLTGSAITTFSVPVLGTYPVDGINADATLLTLDLPACTDDGAGQLASELLNMTGLVTLNLNSLVTPSVDFDLTASPSLASVNLSAMIAPDGTNFNFLGCSLTQASVDHILARLVANPAYISGTVDLSGGTNAAPGVQGALDVIELTGRGVTVTTN